jgi:hypothetical protein
MIVLKNLRNASTRLSMNGKSSIVATAPPFVLRVSKRMNGGFLSRIEMTPDPGTW